MQSFYIRRRLDVRYKRKTEEWSNRSSSFSKKEQKKSLILKLTTVVPIEENSVNRNFVQFCIQTFQLYVYDQQFRISFH